MRQRLALRQSRSPRRLRISGREPVRELAVHAHDDGDDDDDDDDDTDMGSQVQSQSPGLRVRLTLVGGAYDGAHVFNLGSIQLIQPQPVPRHDSRTPRPPVIAAARPRRLRARF
eukprot:2167283-Rhodomonas_salina.1